jgi:hypothetical protein
MKALMYPAVVDTESASGELRCNASRVCTRRSETNGNVAFMSVQLGPVCVTERDY